MVQITEEKNGENLVRDDLLGGWRVGWRFGREESVVIEVSAFGSGTLGSAL